MDSSNRPIISSAEVDLIVTRHQLRGHWPDVVRQTQWWSVRWSVHGRPVFTARRMPVSHATSSTLTVRVMRRLNDSQTLRDAAMCTCVGLLYGVSHETDRHPQ